MPFSLSKAWPLGIVGADLEQVACLDLVEHVVVVGNRQIVVLKAWSLEAMRSSKVH